MTEEDVSEFTTKRRSIDLDGELKWGGDDGEPWSEAVESSENIMVNDDGTITPGSDTSDSAVFDDWDDNKLTNRDDFGMTAYQFDAIPGETTAERPEWVYQVESDEGYVRADNQRLEYVWDGGDVARIGMDNPFDESQMELTTWYAEMWAEEFWGSATQSWEILMEDPNQRHDPNGIRLRVNFHESTLYLRNQNDESDIISASPSLLSSNWHGFLIERDENGNWEIWIDPDDPANPQDSESVGTGTDTYLPDMSSGGMSFTTSHGNGAERRVRRIEVF